MPRPYNRSILELPYQPPVTASGGNPAPHSGATSTASFEVIDDALADLRWTLTQGSAGTAGTGAYRWVMPAGFKINLAAAPVGQVVGTALVRGTAGAVVVAGERELALQVNGEVADDWQGFNLTGTWSWCATVPITF